MNARAKASTTQIRLFTSSDNKIIPHVHVLYIVLALQQLLSGFTTTVE